MPEGQGYQYDVKLSNGETRRVTLDRQMSAEERASPAFLDALGKQLAPPGGPFQSGVPGATIGEPDPSTIPPQPSMPAEVAKAIPENVLGAVGEIGGTAVGGVPGRIAGQAIGGAIGRAGTELVTNPEMSLGERAVSAGRAGAEQVAGGEGMRLVGRATGAMFSRLRPYVPVLRRQVDPEIADSLRFFSTFADPTESRIGKMVGADKVPLLSPGDMLQSPGLRTLENIARGSVLSGEDLMRLDTNLDNAIDRSLNGIMEEFGPQASYDDIGKGLQMVIQDNQKAADLAVKPIYNAIEEATTPTPVKVLKEIEPATTRQVDTGLINDAGKPIMREEVVPAKMEEVTELEGGVKVNLDAARKHAAGAASVARDLNSVNGGTFGDDLVKRIESIEDLPFPEVQELRSRLMFMQRRAKEAGLKTPATRQLGLLIRSVDQSMEKALAAQAPEWLEPWRNVNRITKKNAEKYQNKFIVKLMKMGSRGSLEGAESFARVFQRGKVQNVERLFTAIGADEEAANFGRQVFTKKLIDESQEQGRINGGKLLENITADNMYGQAFRRAFTKDQQHVIRRFAERLRVIQKAQDLPGDSRNPWLKYAQIGALLGLATGKGVGAAVPVLATPAALAKVLASPATGKLVVDGLTVNPTSKAGINIVKRLTLEIAKQAAPTGGGEVALPEPVPEPTTGP